MSTDRKIMVVVGCVCIVGVMVGIIGAAVAPKNPVAWALGAVLSAWLGSAIAQVLKDNPEQ